MPQSLANVLIHLIYSTKNRIPWLKTVARRELMNAYLVGTLRNVDCPSLSVGCVDDHVHILCNLSRTISIANLVKEIKASSSGWIKTQDAGLADFHWQSGYGAFSVSQSQMEGVKAYIANQEEHHRRVSFQDEFRAFLRRHAIPFDDRYVWD